MTADDPAARRLALVTGALLDLSLALPVSSPRCT